MTPPCLWWPPRRLPPRPPHGDRIEGSTPLGGAGSLCARRWRRDRAEGLSSPGRGVLNVVGEVPTLPPLGRSPTKHSATQVVRHPPSLPTSHGRSRHDTKVAVLMARPTTGTRCQPGVDTLERFGSRPTCGCSRPTATRSGHRARVDRTGAGYVAFSAARAWPPTSPAWSPPKPPCRWSGCAVRGCAQRRRRALRDGADAKGIPVATVAIDGSLNAALLVVEMLAITEGDNGGKWPTTASRSLARARPGVSP